jgi:hypothetical protein
MKPKNFPARKNQRRIDAVERDLDKWSAEATKRKSTTYEEARSVRTKKHRG